MLKERDIHLSFINEEGQELVGDRITFSFGANWKKYTPGLEESAIRHAEDSFKTFTKLSTLKDHTFLDVGCGSGLSSLVAYRLGARRVVSVDIDPNSIDCVRDLRSRFASNLGTWEILQGSALDRDFLASLGVFSYVYSWGVLHHTGSMWEAIDNVRQCVEPGGRLHIALYNQYKNSERWLKVKRICNRFPGTVFPILKAGYGAFVYGRLLARFESPFRFSREYWKRRGMSFWRDVDDWLGGLPYEYCKPEEVFDLLYERGFMLVRLSTTGSFGNNEFLFKSQDFFAEND